MFVLVINEPYWHEPIVSKVRRVRAVTEHEVRQGMRGPAKVVKVHRLDMQHPDGEPERFTLSPSMTYRVLTTDEALLEGLIEDSYEEAS